MNWRTIAVVLVAGLINLAFLGTAARACPFCSAQSQTFGEEINSMDVVVLARIVGSPKPNAAATDADKPDADNATREIAKTKFEIVDIIKGDAQLGKTRVVETVYFGDAKQGQSYLIMGVDPPKIAWSTPLALSDRARDYISRLTKLPIEGAERLAYFQQYLEDKDEMLARDAYDEFAKAPYTDVVALKMKMDHDQLVAWINSEDIPASRRRLYLTMLGVCGSADDLPMLEELLRSNDRKKKAGLDALIACYLTMKGADGVGLIEDLFLKNEASEYADTYAAIMALRFHGTETDVVNRKRILEALRHMLDRPKLADLVIPDLARWEDWGSMERLVQLFKDADDKSSWVRVPVINYLRACPDPKSDQYIKELEKIDPGAVKRANTFFPLSPAGGSESSSLDQSESPADESAEQSSSVTSPASATAVVMKVANSRSREPLASVAPLSVPSSHATVAPIGVNRFSVISVTMLVGAGLMLLQWSILRGHIGPAPR